MSTTSRQTSPRPLSPPSNTTTQPTVTPITTTSQSHTSSSAPLHIHPNLPSPSTQRHVSEARTAVIASLSNMVDTSLTPRATILHENARSLEKQEKEVVKATEGLRRETDKLKKEADRAAKGLKEVGHVQNWAEVLERQFMTLEETVRLANGGSEGSAGSRSRGSSCSCSCSDCGRTDAGEGEEGLDGGKGSHDDDDGGDKMILDGQEAAATAWSDTSRSLHGPESSTGTGRAKGSETASVSTSS